ncbi:MAG: succinyldiaminopimelate transaminase [Gammaproteobacteria bacterium]|nr:MAG: succinyldiaminopimelate transaminase [Gammaproteobacteria bacterium]
MNTNLTKLQPYPFEKLNKLISQIETNTQLQAVSLAIGEPKHLTPSIIKDELNRNVSDLAKYPTTRGTDELRKACANWIRNRFQLSEKYLDNKNNVLPVNGTREALFAFAQCVIDPTSKPAVLIPNPFYQIYEGAALLAGAEPIYYDCTVIDGDIPALWEISDEIWNRCQLLYICTPGNPTGEVAPANTLQKLIEHSNKYNFVIASDECYSEIYSPNATPPNGLLHNAQKLGNETFQNCMAFYSLSKRSNAPGLRSGFVAGSSELIENFFSYRTYHGCAMSLPTQAASVAAWSDELHVASNRQKYAEKFDAVLGILQPVLPCQRPDAGFYLWPKLPMDEVEFCKTLFRKKNVLTLPGSYLAKSVNGYNPGENRVRLALVAELAECIEAAQRIKELLEEQ